MKIILKTLFAAFIAGFLTSSINTSSAQFLNLTGGDVRLQLGPPPGPGMDFQPDTDDRTRLMWFFPPARPSKIVVSTVAPGQDFQLFVEATSIIGGNPQPEVQLINGMAPQDFIRDVSGIFRLVGRANLSYRAESSASGNSGSGTDVHTVVYTWIDQ